MKAILSILLIVFVTACSTTDTASRNGAAVKEIAIFQEGQKTAQHFVVIKTLVDDGSEIDEDEITDKFVKQARKVGGDAIILRPKKQSGAQVVPFGFGRINLTFVYRADVIRFE
jgi:hypothetical protein